MDDPLGVRDRAILETLYSTGIRRMEVIGLGLFDLDVERGELSGAGDTITDPPPAGMLAAEDWTNLDANGNWLSWSWDKQLPGGGTDTFSETRTHDSDGANELITRYPSNGPQVALSYDYAGNLTNDGTFTYTYDAHHRLKTVSENMTVRLRIDYDALGRVIRRQLGDSGPETFYVYDAPTPGGPNGYAVVQERDDSGDLLREFIHRAGHLRPVAMIDYTDLGDVAEGTAETFYYVYDERGSVATITDDAGAVVESYSYDAYGGATVYDDTGAVVARWNDPNDWDDHALTPSTVGNPYGFTGHRFSVAGLYETPFRAYSPFLGRWLQRDPLGYVDGVNLYQYVMSSPFNWFDPFGLDSLPRGQMTMMLPEGGLDPSPPPELTVLGELKSWFAGEDSTATNATEYDAGVAAGNIKESYDEGIEKAQEIGREHAADSMYEGIGGAIGQSVGAGLKVVGGLRRIKCSGGGGGGRGPSGKGPGGGGKPIRSKYSDGTPVYEGQQPPRIKGPSPDAKGSPHSVLRTDKVNNRTYQMREFDEFGNPVRDVDKTVPTYPNGTVRPGHPGPPHQHRWVPNPTGGTPKRGNPEPLP